MSQKTNGTYIGTFYSHFGAVHFKKLCQTHKIDGKMMPVPRDLSSSCGTCVRFVCEDPEAFLKNNYPEEMEQLVLVTEQGYDVLYRAENS